MKAIKSAHQETSSLRKIGGENIVRELESLPIEDFVPRTREIICRNIGIPESLQPGIQYAKLIDGAGAAYLSANHLISVSPESLKMERALLYSFMRHELEHTKQNLDILRTEGFGERAAEFYATALAKAEANGILEVFKTKNITNEDIIKGKYNPDDEAFLKKLLLAKGSTTEKEVLEELTEELKPSKLEDMDNFRKLVIEEMGEIPANSRQAKVVRKHFDEFICENCLQESKDKAFQQDSEIAAYSAGDGAFAAYRQYLR